MNEFSTAIKHDQLSEGFPPNMFHIRLVLVIDSTI